MNGERTYARECTSARKRTPVNPFRLSSLASCARVLFSSERDYRDVPLTYKDDITSHNDVDDRFYLNFQFEPLEISHEQTTRRLRCCAKARPRSLEIKSGISCRPRYKANLLAITPWRFRAGQQQFGRGAGRLSGENNDFMPDAVHVLAHTASARAMSVGRCPWFSWLRCTFTAIVWLDSYFNEMRSSFMDVYT